MGDVQTFVLGDADPPPHFKPSAVRSEYVNHAKGKKQVLWERGLWVDGTIDKIPEDDLHRDQALSMTPKGHCELAGKGIKYCWGRMKKHFRKNNRCDMGKFNALILTSMSREVLPLMTARKFARTRTSAFTPTRRSASSSTSSARSSSTSCTAPQATSPAPSLTTHK